MVVVIGRWHSEVVVSSGLTVREIAENGLDLTRATYIFTSSVLRV